LLRRKTRRDKQPFVQPFPVTFVHTKDSLGRQKTVPSERLLSLQPAPLPYVTEFVYDHPYYHYERAFVPADPIFISDSTPKAQDFMD